jgi:hypothetical protein
MKILYYLLITHTKHTTMEKLHPEIQLQNEINFFTNNLTIDRGIIKWATTDYWAPDDVNFISASTTGEKIYYIAELKERHGNYSSTFIEKNGCLMQQSKLEKLKEKAKEIQNRKHYNVRIMYITKCSDGVCLCYDVTDHSTEVYYQKQMQFESGSTRNINKKCINLTNWCQKWI